MPCLQRGVGSLWRGPTSGGGRSKSHAAFCHSWQKLVDAAPTMATKVKEILHKGMYITMYIVHSWLLTQVKITFPPDVWMLEDTVVSKEGGDFVVCGFIISEYLS